jgi:SEC-C motif-containing protein
MNTTCPCGSELSHAYCCEPLLLEYKTAETAEQLMRSRYSAYSTGKVDYLVSTTHPSTRHRFSRKEIEAWSKSNKWLKLEIVESLPTVVEFKAHYMQGIDPPKIHHERSTFVLENGKWYYLDGIFRR